MSRPSQILNHPQKNAIERALLSGQVSIAQVSAQFGVSRDCLYRYKHSNLAPALRDALAASNEHIPSLLERVLALAEDALQTRQALAASGQHIASIQAGAHELKTLTVLLDRLGVDSTDTVDALREAFQLAEAIRQLAGSNPNAVRELADILLNSGNDELSAALQHVASIQTPTKGINS